MSGPRDDTGVRRILLKLSGEALMGDQGFGISQDMLDHVSTEIAEAASLGAQVGVHYQATPCLGLGLSVSTPTWFETHKWNTVDHVGVRRRVPLAKEMRSRVLLDVLTGMGKGGQVGRAQRQVVGTTEPAGQPGEMLLIGRGQLNLLSLS